VIVDAIIPFNVEICLHMCEVPYRSRFTIAVALLSCYLVCISPKLVPGCNLGIIQLGKFGMTKCMKREQAAAMNRQPLNHDNRQAEQDKRRRQEAATE
jgi:hypothetical protein